MPIQLIDPTKDRTYAVDGSIFHYCEMPGDVEAKIREKSIKVKMGKGRRSENEIITTGFSAGILAWGVRGWEGVEDANGTAIPFDKSLLPMLPADIRDKLESLIMREDEELGLDGEKKGGGVSEVGVGGPEGEDT